jgi:hypothetical protein
MIALHTPSAGWEGLDDVNTVEPHWLVPPLRPPGPGVPPHGGPDASLAAACGSEDEVTTLSWYINPDNGVAEFANAGFLKVFDRDDEASLTDGVLMAPLETVRWKGQLDDGSRTELRFDPEQAHLFDPATGDTLTRSPARDGDRQRSADPGATRA